MSLTLAAVGAVVAALVQLSVGPYIQVAGAQPNIVLVFTVIWTMIVGFEGGLVWAFVGGLLLDLLGSGNLGASAFTLLVCVAVASVIARVFTRARFLTPVAVVFVLAVFDFFSRLLLDRLLRGVAASPDVISLAVPAAVYDLLLAAIVAPITLVFYRRFGERERIDW